MLLIKFKNDGTGDEILANYDYTVNVNYEVIAEGRLENHVKENGWEFLVMKLARDLAENIVRKKPEE